MTSPNIQLHPERPRFSPIVSVATGIVLLSTVALLDWLTGPELDFALFYLIPVGFVTWFAGERFGYVTCLIAAGVWLCVDRLTGAKSASSLVIEWNFAMRFLFFCASVLLLNGWHNLQRGLARIVDLRTRALRELSSQLFAAEDAERRKLAYDMHDALSQSLSLIKMNLDAAQLDADDRPQHQKRLASCGEMIDEVIKQTRTLMFDLHPAMLDDLGLVPTLQWYAKEFEHRTAAELFVTEDGSRIALPVALGNYLFRAIKELLANAVKHGRAKEVIVAVHWERSRLRVVVDDDGTGFDPAAVNASSVRHGLGLPGIRERVASMGGRLSIESNSGQGTRVVVELPVASSVNATADATADHLEEAAHALSNSSR